MISILFLKTLVIVLVLYQTKSKQQNQASYFILPEENITVKLNTFMPDSTPQTKYVIQGQYFQQHPPFQVLKVQRLVHQPQSGSLHDVFESQTTIFGAVIGRDLHFYYSNYNQNIMLCNLKLQLALYQKVIIVKQGHILLLGPKFLVKVQYVPKQSINQSCIATKYQLNISTALKRCSSFGSFACFSNREIILPYNHINKTPIVIESDINSIVGVFYNEKQKQLQLFKNSSYLYKYKVQNNFTLTLLKSQSIFDSESTFMEKNKDIYFIVSQNTVTILKQYPQTKQILNKIQSPISNQITALEISPNDDYLIILYISIKIHEAVVIQFSQQQYTNYYTYNSIINTDHTLFLKDSYQILFTNQTHYWLSSKNPQYIIIQYSQQNRTLLLKSILDQIVRTFEINIQPRQENQLVVIDELPEQSQIDYDGQIYFNLNEIIAGSKIVCYQLTLNSYEEHSRAQFQWNSTVQLIKDLLIITIYINQPCIDIVTESDNSFFRLFKALNNTIYIERCTVTSPSTIFICGLSQKRIIQQNQLHAFSLGNKNYAIIEKSPNWSVSNQAKDDSQLLLFEDVIDIKTQNQILFTHMKTKKTSKYPLTQQEENCIYKNYPNSILICPTYVLFFSFKDSILITRRMPNLIGQVKYAFLHNDILILGNQQLLQKYNILSSSPKLQFSLPLNASNNLKKYHVLDQYLFLEYEDSYKIFDCSKTKISILLAQQDGVLLSKPIFLGQEYIAFILNTQKNMRIHQLFPAASFGEITPLPYYNKVKGLFTISAFQSQCDGIPQAKTQGIKWINFQSLQITKVNFQAKVIGTPYSTQLYYQPLHDNMFYGSIVSYYLSDDFNKSILLQTHLNNQACDQFIAGKYFIESIFKVSNPNIITYSLLYYSNNTTLVQMIKFDPQPVLIETFDFRNKSLIDCLQYSDQFGSVVFCPQFIGFLNINSTAVLIDFALEKNKFSLRIDSAIQIRLFVLEVNEINNTTVMVKYILQRLDKRIYKQSTKTYEDKGLSVSVYQNGIAVLLAKSLCLLFPDNTSACTETQNFLYNKFQHTQDYLQVQIYRVNAQQNEIDLLLISSIANNIHLDIKTTKYAPQYFLWNITSVYGGYKGYQCSGLKYIKISPQSQNIQYFVLSYQDDNDQNNLLGFYKFESRFISKGIIGNMIEALYINSSFPKSVFFQGDNIYMQKECFNYNATLYLLLNYAEPPPVSYLVLHAHNDLSKNISYIKLSFQSEVSNYLGFYIGFGVVALIILVLIFINRILPKIRRKTKSLKYGSSSIAHNGLLSSDYIETKSSKNQNLKEENNSK